LKFFSASARREELLAKPGALPAHVHADASAPGRALDDQRKPDALGLALRVLFAFDEPRSGKERHAELECECPGTVLGPEPAYLCSARPDERETARLDQIGEVGVLGEEAVAGVHGLGAGLASRVEDRLGVEVAPRRGGRPDADRLVGVEHVPRVTVRFRVDGDALDPEPGERALDPTGDLAAIGDQYFLEHEVGCAALVASPKSGCEWASDRIRCRDC
jgi:hypothetical protein